MATEYKKFKLVYGAEDKNIKGSLTGIPTKEDPAIVTFENYDAKLVYENKEHELLASITGIPAEGDRVIGTRKELEGMDVEIKVDGAKEEEVKEEAKEPDAPQPEAGEEAVTDPIA